MNFSSSADAAAYFATHEGLAPGTEGFWKVWGARVSSIREGDLVLIPGDEGSSFSLITGTFAAKAAPMRRGLIDPEHGEFTLGALCPVIVLRWGTHNTLA